MSIFAIRKPQELKGVYATKKGIKKAKEALKDIEKYSTRIFEDNQKEEAFEWAGVKGFADAPQKMALDQQKDFSNTTSLNNNHFTAPVKMSAAERIIAICEDFRKSGHSFIQLYLSDDKVLGIFLEGAATGEIRKRYSDDSEQESIEYSLKNNYVKVFAKKTEIKYMEPFLVLKNAWTASKTENRGVKNVVIDHEISTIINMELIDIVEAIAFTKYQYTSNYSVYSIEKSNMELYKKVKPYL